VSREELSSFEQLDQKPFDKTALLSAKMASISGMPNTQLSKALNVRQNYIPIAGNRLQPL
jgi:hypothetical protein